MYQLWLITYPNTQPQLGLPNIIPYWITRLSRNCIVRFVAIVDHIPIIAYDILKEASVAMPLTVIGLVLRH